MTVHIVGNGLFGRIASDLLAREGIANIVYDAGFSNAGTTASGNITKPGWVTGLGDAARVAYRDLDEMYGLHKFEPEVLLGKKIELYYVHRNNVVLQPCVKAVVHLLGDGELQIVGKDLKGHVIGDPVLIAAGVWTGELVPVPGMDTITGVSYIFRKPDDYKPRFNMWAPYKQAISYADGSHVWFGDGTAIKEKNWSTALEDRALDRAKEHGLVDLPLSKMVGYRPYVKGHKNGYFKKVGDKTWVSTGGGKNGIVLAAVQARQFLEELRQSGYR